MLEDVEDCGIPGTEEDETSARSVADEVTVEECLWDCEWQHNPFYKGVLQWNTKLRESNFTTDNTHLLLFTSPQVPRNLTCLQDCFIRFEAGSDWAKRSKIRRKCSANGLDRLIPTHTQEGQDFIESSYSDALLFWKNNQTFASVNPNLDCLEWKGKKFRQKSAVISNYIEGIETASDGGADKAVINSRLTWVKSATKKKVKKRTKPKKKNGKLKKKNGKMKKKRSRNAKRFTRQADEEDSSVRVDEEWYWQGTRQFSTNVEAVHREEGEEDLDQTWQRFMFRATNPVAKAVELCSLAKLIQIVNAGPTKEKLPALFGSGPEVCDQFLPDLFRPTCRCVGRCRNTNRNKIRHFFTEEGLWGCQNACKNEDGCKFYTLSRPNPDYILDIGAPDVNRCILWKECDSFEIPEGSTTRNNSVSDHWSGAAECGLWDQKCPLLEELAYDEESESHYQSTSPWTEKSSSTRGFGSSTFSVNQKNK